MIYLTALITISLAAMNVTFDGSNVFIRQTKLIEQARYSVNHNLFPARAVFSENWFNLDGSTLPDWTPSKKVTASNEMHSLELSDYYTAAAHTRAITHFDGHQHDDQLDKFNQRVWHKLYADTASERVNVVYNRESTSGRFRDLLLDKNDAITKALALKYPYAAAAITYLKPEIQGSSLSLTNLKHSLYVFTALDTFLQNGRIEYPASEDFEKLSWLKGKYLLGRTRVGEIVFINVNDTCTIHKQFNGRYFMDCAVDVKRPWRFVLLDAYNNIIYVNLGCVTAMLRKHEDDKEVITKKLTQKTSYTLLKTGLSYDYRVSKLWFHGDKIGIFKEGVDSKGLGELIVYKLEDTLTTFNMDDVRSAPDQSKCLEYVVKQLEI